MANLMLHQGSGFVGREELRNVFTPPPTHSWQPIAHEHLLSTVEQQLGRLNYHVTAESHGLSKNGSRYFGLLEIGANSPLRLLPMHLRGLFCALNRKGKSSMNQRKLNQEVAFKTGETISEIARRGFSVAHWIPSDTGIVPIDWDLEEARRYTALLPDQQGNI